MERYLQSYTIVPKELYVERMADRQIVNIINDMGRPGYVLVARQMGKTNLLLHVKQKMEDDRNIFVYLDFSSIPIYDDRSFFELLINKAIECREHVFAEAADKVTKLRSERIYDSINRYTAELLILLEYVDKIVFVLDEIEKLTRNKYSDSIFSQIRSDYFQRVNYPDLYKVTYILSGVFEPKDLIKDPNVSPFNIGEKIYLRSFNRKEMCSFIEKAYLPFTEVVKDELEKIVAYKHGISLEQALQRFMVWCVEEPENFTFWHKNAMAKSDDYEKRNEFIKVMIEELDKAYGDRALMAGIRFGVDEFCKRFDVDEKYKKRIEEIKRR